MPDAAVNIGPSFVARPLARVLNGGAFYLVLLALLLSPLLWGAIRPWAWYPLQMLVFSALVLYGIDRVIRGQDGVDADETPPFLVWAPLVAFLLFVALQIVPLPGFLLDLIAPASARYYFFVPGSAVSISVDKGATAQDLLLYAAYACAFLVLYATLTSRSRIRTLIYALAGVAVLEVIVAVHSVNNQLYLVPKQWIDGHFEMARGTFVNPNHFAGFLMTVGALVLGLIYGNILKHWQGVRRLRVTDVVAELGTSTGALIIILAMIVAGAVFSGSRGAPGASLVALFMVIGAAAVVRRGSEVRILVPTFFVLLIALFWLGAGQDLGKIIQEGASFAGRLHLWSLSLDVAWDHWLTGSGVGTYALVFSGYRDGTLRPLHYDSPHSDYLETFIEVGIIGSVLLVLFVSATLSLMVRAFVTRHSHFYRGILFGVLIAVLGFLIHSLVDFNFRIPANALLFFSLCALGLRAAQLPRGE